MSRPKGKRRYPLRRNETTIADSTRARTLADLSWGATRGFVTVDGENVPARTMRTQRARDALEARFLREADGDVKAAQSLKRAYYREIGQKGARARWKKQPA